jgi:PAS domain S-box-containing protein
MGNVTPFIILARRPPGKVIIEEITFGTEVSFSRGSDARTALSDLLLLIKQTMLKKKAERELRVRNEQLAGILSATPLGIFQVQNNAITWVNRSFATMLGYGENELVGKELGVFFKNADEYGQLARDVSIRRPGGPQGVAECGLVKKGGGTLAVRLQVLPLDQNDVIRGGTFVVTDITEKKNLADALKASEARYREMVANTQSIIIRMDLAGTITFFNTYALSFFDYTADEVIGKNVVGTIVDEKGRGGHDLSMMANDLGFNAEGYAINVNENIRRNGDRVWIAWINKAIRDESGHIVEILCIGNDITDRRRGSGEVRISTDTWKDQVVADTDIREEVFDTVFHISTEISIEGREGKAVGTTFLIGDSKNVLAKSRQIMLNAFEGHKPESRMVTSPDLKENIKEFAQLDGAFIIGGDGFIEASGRYITVDTSCVTLPKGMGTRHNSVAAITAVTNAVGIVVSQSGGGITIFKNGQILKKITL